MSTDLDRQKKKFREQRYTTISFPSDALKPLRKLYWQIYAETVEPEVQIGMKLHEVAPEFGTVNMRWFFANSEAAIKIFRDVLDGCGLRSAREIFGSSFAAARVIQANFIEVRGSYPIGTWHSDFTDEALKAGQSATLLTPLFTLKPHLGGLEITHAQREDLDYDSRAEVYRYKDGEAILFDGSAMIHRTQSYSATPEDRRILISWQLADTRSELRPILDRIGIRNGDPMFLSDHLVALPAPTLAVV